MHLTRELNDEEGQIQYVLFSSVSVFSTLGALSNILVIILVVSSKRLRTFLNGFVLSLAVSDFLFTTSLFVYVSRVHKGHDLLKAFATFFVAFSSVAELANLCAVTYERYLAVVKPLHYKVRIKRYFCVVIPLIWLSSLLACSLIFLRLTDITRLQGKILLASLAFIFVLIPLVTIVVFYCYIFVHLVSHRRALGNIFNQNIIQQRKKQEAKIVKMFGLVAFLYILSAIPAILHEFVYEIEHFRFSGWNISLAHFLSTMGMVLSSLANPYIYTFAKQDFRQQIKRIYKKIRCCVNEVQPVLPGALPRHA